ncbi:MAG: NAD(+) diphosphatase [Desulfuromonadales bacterium]|nr:NAD(+) diphosphatase [Desulfuromonadales bacterium]
MTSLAGSYASPMHLPFNRTCLAEQFVLQPPADDPGGPGYGVLLRGSKMLVARQQGRVVLPFGEWHGNAASYLGRWRGQPCRLIDLSDAAALPENLEMCGLLDENPQLPIDLLSIGGMGRMILHWQERSCFCGYCGQPTKWLAKEWGRGCDACHNHMFPAIHPCAIVLITRPGEVLLTRKSNWAANRYSLVAGFQEFGESLEETAIREVAEETGVKVGNVRYVGSQCWPFPSQVMVGFVADYVTGDIRVDTTELEDARWFAVDDLPGLPPKRSIARYILDKTLDLV